MSRKVLFPAVLLSGGALSLAFPEPDLAPVAWFALVPLLLACLRLSFRDTLLCGALFGAAFFGTLLIWVSIVGYVAWAVLVVVQTVFVIAFAATLAALSRRLPMFAWVATAVALWVAFEFLRSVVPVGGFTWGQLSQSQHNLPWMLRLAPVTGGWGVSALVVAINACLATALTAGRREVAAPLALAVALTAGGVVLPAPEPSGGTLDVAIVQGNVPRSFSGSHYDKELAITRSHARLTAELEPGSADLVVWPESAVGLDIRRDLPSARAVRTAARAAGVPMIVGGNLDIDEDRYQVVAFHVSPDGDIVDVYRKTHLVPFGEYVPARGVFGRIPMLDQVGRDAVPGDEAKVFEIGDARVGTVISFEGDFSSVARQPFARGAQVLVVATNTSTWRESWASAQHVAFSRVRAAENGSWVVHAALSGISAFVSPTGEVTARTDLWTATPLVGRVRLREGPTFYARWGEWFPLLCAGASVSVLLLAVRRRGRG